MLPKKKTYHPWYIGIQDHWWVDLKINQLIKIIKCRLPFRKLLKFRAYCGQKPMAHIRAFCYWYTETQLYLFEEELGVWAGKADGDTWWVPHWREPTDVLHGLRWPAVVVPWFPREPRAIHCDRLLPTAYRLLAKLVWIPLTPASVKLKSKCTGLSQTLSLYLSSNQWKTSALLKCKKMLHTEKQNLRLWFCLSCESSLHKLKNITIPSQWFLPKHFQWCGDIGQRAGLAAGS